MRWLRNKTGVTKNMRLNRWLPIAVALVGICNVEVVGRWYLLNRLVTQPLNDGGTSPLAIGLQNIDAELRSRQIIVTPETKVAAIKNAVSFAPSSVSLSFSWRSLWPYLSC